MIETNGYTNMPSDNINDDWEIDANGLWVATRGFLIRRGYCCANQCRNCPYINWRNFASWQPAPPDAVQYAEVSPKAIAGAQERLSYHQQALKDGDEKEQGYHRAMVAHYRLLIERWDEAG